MYRYYYSIPHTVICLYSSSQKSNRFLFIINRSLIRYLKECELIYISMSIIKKVFCYEETQLPVFKCKDEIWFGGKTIAGILGYAIQPKAIREHVDPEDRVRLAELRGVSESRGSKTDPLTNNEKTQFI